MIVANGGGGGGTTKPKEESTTTLTREQQASIGEAIRKGEPVKVIEYAGPPTSGGGITATPAYTPPKEYAGPPTTSGAPYAPPPTCPPGESLYKVSTTKGVEYTYAASSGAAQELVGPGFVTKVMSPAAYGEDQPYREVTTIGGQKVMAPYSPEREAKSEYLHIFGTYPTAGASQKTKDWWQGVAQQIQAGTYISPLTNIPVVQEIADRSGLSYQQALTEARTIANQALNIMATTGSCGPVGMTKDEGRLASAYLESIGRVDEAEEIKKYATAIGSTLRSQIERAEAVGYGLYDDLAPYRTGTSYDLSSAFADKVIKEKDKPQLLEMGFSEAMITGAVASAAILSAVGVGIGAGANITIADLGTALVAGKVTKDQISEVYGEKVAGEVVDYNEKYPQGVGAEAAVVAPSGKGFWQRGWEFLTPQAEEAGQTFGQWFTRPGTLIGAIMGKEGPTQEELKVRYEAQQAQTGWQRFLSGPSVVYHPDLGKYGEIAAGYGPIIIPGGGIAGGLLTAGGTRIGQVALGTTKTLIKLGAGAAGGSTLGAGIHGALIPSKEGTWEVEQQRVYQEYLTSPEYFSEKQRIETESGGEYTIKEPTFQEFSDAMGWEHTPLAYQGGIQGIMGRGWEAQTKAFANLRGDAPWYTPKSLLAGFGSYLASPALAADLYTHHGPSAALAAIPHFGPTWGYTGLEWGNLSNLQRGLGIGFGFAPYVTGPLGAGLGKVGRVISTKAPGFANVVGFPFKVVRWTGRTTGVSPVLATLERGAPWQLAYTAGRGFKYVPGPLGGATQKAITAGWLGSTTPLSDMWKQWLREPATGFGRTTSEIGTPEGRLAEGTMLERAYKAWGVTSEAELLAAVKGEYGMTPLPALREGGGSWSSVSPRGAFSWQYGAGSVPPAIYSPAPAWYLQGPRGLQVPTVGVSSPSIGGVLSTLGKVGAAGTLIAAPWIGGIPIGIGVAQQQVVAVDNMLQQGQVTQAQHDQLIQQIQQTQQSQVTSQQQVQQVNQVVEVTLNQQQQQQYQQQVQQVQQQVQQQQQVPQVQQQFLQQVQQVQQPFQQQTQTIFPQQVQQQVPPSPLPPPPIFPFFPGAGFMGPLGGGVRGKKGKKGLLGIGAWKFRGFQVGGTHPLTGKPTSYTFMGGETMPYGIGKRVPRVRTTKKKKGGVGMVRLYRGSLGI